MEKLSLKKQNKTKRQKKGLFLYLITHRERQEDIDTQRQTFSLEKQSK